MQLGRAGRSALAGINKYGTNAIAEHVAQDSVCLIVRLGAVGAADQGDKCGYFFAVDGLWCLTVDFSTISLAFAVLANGCIREMVYSVAGCNPLHFAPQMAWAFEPWWGKYSMCFAVAGIIAVTCKTALRCSGIGRTRGRE